MADEEDRKENLIDNNISAINASARPSDINQINPNRIKEDNEEVDKKEQEEKFESSKYSILIVIIFFLLNFINGMHWVTFAACAAKFGKFYHLNNIQVDLLSIIFMIVYIVSSYPCSWLIDKKSIRLGLSLSACSLTIGAILKIFIYVDISFAYIGQFFASLLQPAILNSTSKIAAIWFSAKWRVLVTSICCVSNTIGVIFGYIFHIFIIDENVVNPKIFKKQFRIYLIVEAVITITCSVIFCVFMREKPKKPPSLSEKNKKNNNKRSTYDEVKLLIADKNFRYIFLSLSCTVGYVNNFATIFNYYMALYKISDTHASYISGIANIFGIISAIIISSIIDKRKEKYKTILFICNSLGIIFYVINTFVLELVESKYLHWIVGSLFCLVIGSVIPIYSSGMDFVAEITHGIGESTSNGVIMIGNQFLGIIGIVISGLLIKYVKESKYLTNIFCICMLVFSLFGLYKVKNDLKRSDEDEGKNTIREDPNKTGLEEE